MFICYSLLQNLLYIEPSVLVPGLDLSVGQMESSCQFISLVYIEVLLFVEALLKNAQLTIGKRRASFPRLFTRYRGTHFFNNCLVTAYDIMRQT